MPHGRRPDNTIYRTDSNGRISQQWLDIENNQDLYENTRFEGIDLILFDYYMGRNKGDIFGPSNDAKIPRNYHADNRFLFIVLYGYQKETNLPALRTELARLQNDKPNSAIKNIEIITYQEFLSFIGIDNDPNGVSFLKEFNDINQDVIDAVNQELTEGERLAAQERLRSRRIAARRRLDNFRDNGYLGGS